MFFLGLKKVLCVDGVIVSLLFLHFACVFDQEVCDFACLCICKLLFGEARSHQHYIFGRLFVLILCVVSSSFNGLLVNRSKDFVRTKSSCLSLFEEVFRLKEL